MVLYISGSSNHSTVTVGPAINTILIQVAKATATVLYSTASAVRNTYTYRYRKPKTRAIGGGPRRLEVAKA